MQMSIAESFRDGTILITGGTGFLGKILIEKLLRSCFVKNIILLVRNKTEISSNQRFAEICGSVIFERLRREKPNFMNSIKIIAGDISQTSMGLSKVDREWLVENVNFVFHCAATIRFNESLSLATKINIQGTENMLELAKEMKNLKGFVHVSTAYTHCVRSEIKEEYYPVPITADELKNTLNNTDESSSGILGKWPNTYTFTKAITENMISSNEYNLPISIFRPSIITFTKSEPEPGWIDNMNGTPTVIAPLITGFMRTAPIDKDNIADIIPVDYTANALISVMWDTVNRYQETKQTIKKPKIFNYVSCVESPLTYRNFINKVYITYHKIPPLGAFWYIFCIFSTNVFVTNIIRILLHRIPAAIVDSYLIITGRSPKIMKMYSKLDSVMDMLHVFLSKEWKFDNHNTQELWSQLNTEDRKTFAFSFENFNWDSYIEDCVYGVRKYILHEDNSNLKEALAKNRRLFWLHNLSLFLIFYIASRLIMKNLYF